MEAKTCEKICVTMQLPRPVYDRVTEALRGHPGLSRHAWHLAALDLVAELVAKDPALLQSRLGRQ